MILRKKDSVIFFTKIRFFQAFLFLILLSTGIFMLLIYEVAQAEKDALLISVMSNQEGFIHRTTVLASSYAQSNDPRERKSLRDKVHETLTMILVFANGSPDGNITKAQVPAILNREVYHLYRGSPSKLNDEVVDYIASVKKFMLGSPIHVSSDYPHLKALNAQTIRLLSVLRAGVKKHQQETRRQILFLKNLGIALFVLMLVSLDRRPFCVHARYSQSRVLFAPTEECQRRARGKSEGPHRGAGAKGHGACPFEPTSPGPDQGAPQGGGRSPGRERLSGFRDRKHP